MSQRAEPAARPGRARLRSHPSVSSAPPSSGCRHAVTSSHLMDLYLHGLRGPARRADDVAPRTAHHVGRIPGEPFSRMRLRTSGREVAAIELPARGLPHVNVERGELLSSLAATLPPDAVTYGVRCTDVRSLSGDHDLVAITDGANSALRSVVGRPPRHRWTWTVWQACITADVPEVPAGSGAGIIRPGLFSGIWRLVSPHRPRRPTGPGPAGAGVRRRARARPGTWR